MYKKRGKEREKEREREGEYTELIVCPVRSTHDTRVVLIPRERERERERERVRVKRPYRLSYLYHT